MDTRSIGQLEVSVVGLGCNNFGWRLDQDRTRQVVNACLDSGVNFFDTADIYGDTKSEVYLGEALVGHRAEVVIASKFGFPLGGTEQGGASARWIKEAVEGSLRRLGTDYLDLYQQHVPDPDTPSDETLGALDELVREGKVREVGHSNLDADQMAQADALARDRGTARFVSAQNELSLLRRNALASVVPACAELGLALLPYLPLANGLLTGKYRRGEGSPAASRLAGMPEDRAAKLLSDRNFDLIERLDALAQERGHSLLELAFGWLLDLAPVASVIAGASTPDQVRSNVAAGTSWRLDVEERAMVTQLLETPSGTS